MLDVFIYSKLITHQEYGQTKGLNLIFEILRHNLYSVFIKAQYKYGKQQSGNLKQVNCIAL